MSPVRAAPSLSGVVGSSNEGNFVSFEFPAEGFFKVCGAWRAAIFSRGPERANSASAVEPRANVGCRNRVS